METRIIEQTRVYILSLNRVTDRFESSNIVAISFEYDKLCNWYNEQFATVPYRDELNYYKVFKKDSELEWYNPADTIELNKHDSRYVGIRDEWVLSSDLDNIMNRYLCI